MDSRDLRPFMSHRTLFSNLFKYINYCLTFLFLFTQIAHANADQPVCSVSIANNWWSGSQVSVTVSNPGNQIIEGWHVELTYSAGQVVHSWSSNREGVNPALFSPPGWKPNLAPSEGYVFGFIANHPTGPETPAITACYTGDGPILDSDLDGIDDAGDLCPATPDGEAVDADGCGWSQLDADDDAIFNPDDTCPNTPVNENVNSDGCGATQLDDDNDGVVNASDACPATPETDTADSNGCGATQLDDDNDGVMNASDSCPATPETDTADINGCGATQLDDDNDSVMNASDNCPATPSTDTADANGCGATQLDDDNDGVMNASDSCPATPSTDTADANGCGATQLDDDNDGVMNANDVCPATPETDTADSNGCGATQLDDDNDGVMNASDNCPATPSTDTADANGCGATQLDDDNDGVVNASDNCPATPFEEPVDSNGCGATQLDEDIDGIVDAFDQCPATPAGELVDANGCSAAQLDEDGDGVEDTADFCPGTPTGETVDIAGCGASQLDDDQDGVANADDRCPMSSSGGPVDEFGCAWDQLDDDGDGVLNPLDGCPETLLGSNVDEFGCAAHERDSDGDGLFDNEDLCPDSSSGMITPFGCDIAGDEDGDFITNDIDLCPFDFGLAVLSGCPSSFGDFDSDGVLDEIDECPYSLHPEAIRPPHIRPAETDFIAANGCADSDFDMVDPDPIPWGNDKCNLPSMFDPAMGTDESGCSEAERADNDADGTINGLDLCPDQFGHPLQNGCPNPDTDPFDIDLDGVPNEQDSCPFSTSITEVSINGCSHFTMQGKSPDDGDLDGLPDDIDQCLNTPWRHVVDGVGCTPNQRLLTEDSDLDGIMDLWDACEFSGSNEPRQTTAYGCDAHEFFQDGDRDGIPDEVDTCPMQAGLSLHLGCPNSFTTMDESSVPSADSENSNTFADTDRDFTPNSDDLCPYSRVSFAGELHPGLLMIEDGCSARDLQDDDYDGIINGLDRCPRTPSTAFLDAQGCNDLERLDFDGDDIINGEDLCPYQPGYWRLNGCPLDPWDADMDGLPNDQDQCPLTVAAEFGPMVPVDASTGCAETMFRDSDRDGVFNDMDRCPNTPLGQLVHRFNTTSDDTIIGCSYQQILFEDLDGDLVEDIRDQCPDTPAGEFVDSVGCADPFGDNDGDNVPNDLDLCPETLAGLPVKFDGCSSTARLTLLAPIERRYTVNEPPAPVEPIVIELLQDNLLTIEGDALGGFIDFEVQSLAYMEEVFINFDHAGGRIFIDVMPQFPDREIHIALRIYSDVVDQWSNWSEIILKPNGGSSDTELASVIVNDPLILAEADIRLTDIFNVFTNHDGFAATQLFKQFWASQKSFVVDDSPFVCDPSSTPFPVVCDRPETDVAFFDDFQAQMEMDLYRLTAVVNRIDLRRPDWQDCGEQRLVFAIPNDPRGRLFLNFEARLPNPMPGTAEGCRTIIEFWRDLPLWPSFEQGFRIREMFVMETGMPYTPIMLPEHFTGDMGQIRTNQFMGGEWMLSEHKLRDTCNAMRCGPFVESVNVAASPFGPLFDPQLAMSPDPLAGLAAAFQDEFVFELLDDLASLQFGDLRMDSSDQFNQRQSFSAGPEAQDSHYLMHFESSFGPSPFRDQLMNRVGLFANADGSPLMPEQVIARATAMSCAGCHNPQQAGLTQPGVIGVLELPDGTWIDRWPESLDFVHIDEFGNLSPALHEVFLPVRQSQFDQVLQELSL